MAKKTQNYKKFIFQNLFIYFFAKGNHTCLENLGCDETCEFVWVFWDCIVKIPFQINNYYYLIGLKCQKFKILLYLNVEILGIRPILCGA